MNRTMLIVGGAGFIGEAMAICAAGSGWRVVVADRLSQDKPRSGQRIPALDLDITDPEAVAATVARISPDVVVQLAAHGAGRAGLAAGAEQDPIRATQVNVGGLINVVSAAGSAGCRKVIWSSSSTVFGTYRAPGPDGVTEAARTKPGTIYGATKLAAEELVRVVAPAVGVTASGLRLPLVYGPGRWYGGSQESLVDFVDDLVSGDDPHIEAWTAPADWIHVDDAASCLLAAANAESPASIYNVAGHRASLAELATELATAAGLDPARCVTPTPVGDPQVPLMNATAVTNELGFRPVYTTASAGAIDYLARSRDRRPQEDQ